MASSTPHLPRHLQLAGPSNYLLWRQMIFGLLLRNDVLPVMIDAIKAPCRLPRHEEEALYKPVNLWDSGPETARRVLAHSIIVMSVRPEMAAGLIGAFDPVECWFRLAAECVGPEGAPGLGSGRVDVKADPHVGRGPSDAGRAAEREVCRGK